jgi:hypothetical protein
MHSLIMLKRSPLPKIIPIFAVVLLRNDSAIAQTVQPQPLPQPQPYTVDTFSAIAILVSGATAVVAIAPKLLEKWFGGAIEARQNKNDLHTLITKSQAELELEDEKRKLESANELSNFYLESARESRKKQEELLTLFITKELDRSAQTNDQLYALIDNQRLMIARLEAIERQCMELGMSIKDIFAVLKIKERESNQIKIGE